MISGMLPLTTEAVVDEISVIIVAGICIGHILSAFWQKTNELADNVESQRNTCGDQKVWQYIVKNWARNLTNGGE